MTPSVVDWCPERRGHMTSYGSLGEATNGLEEEFMKVFASFLIAVSLVVPAFAQQPPDPAAVVGQVLELSSDQITAWTAILHARDAAIQPLAQQAQSQQQALGQLLGVPNPDPLAVGQAVVALHALQT